MPRQTTTKTASRKVKSKVVKVNPRQTRNSKQTKDGPERVNQDEATENETCYERIVRKVNAKRAAEGRVNWRS